MKVIIWGHKLHSHTHSYIHYGFWRAFQYMGYDTHWFDDSDDVSSFDFSNSMFLTEGQVCHNMPRRKDCGYVLHNCPYMYDLGKRINIQYYNKNCVDMEHLAHGIAYNGGCLYFPWGSPLLPYEFDSGCIEANRSNRAYFLGTVNTPEEKEGNLQSLTDFAVACKEVGVDMYVGGGYTGGVDSNVFKHIKGWISEEDQIKYLKEAYAVPSVQGSRQIETGMIPCRLFKAISYGNDGLTNNAFANSFFEYSLVYARNGRDLFFAGEDKKEDIERKLWLFEFVKTNHTYLNNCKAILEILWG